MNRSEEKLAQVAKPTGFSGKMQKWSRMSVGNYNAPARIVIVADKSAPSWFVFDIGIVTQTIALAAQEYGLGTCILGDAAGILMRCEGLQTFPSPSRSSSESLLATRIGMIR